jgi:hypothetical protein
MLTLAGLVLSMSGALMLVAINLAKAPEGFEDENGFHFVGKPRPRSRASLSEPVKGRFVSLHLPGPMR